MPQMGPSRGKNASPPQGGEPLVEGAVTMIYLIVSASDCSEKWIPLFGPML
jgi:hypothetical protein